MANLRIGLIGCASTAAAKQIAAMANLAEVEFSAAFDAHADALRVLPDEVTQFESPAALLDSGTVDAVIVHTPLKDRVEHISLAIDAGVHVLVERPLAATANDAKQLIDRHVSQSSSRSTPTVFAVNLTHRLRHTWLKVQQIVDSGELGQILRAHWTLTDQFRAHSFYTSTPGRGTFKNDGGGLLMSQYHANLDLLTYILGKPTHAAAVVKFGRFHPIDVEDEVFATLEYASGTHASIVASTAEPMGNNRLEIVGSNAMLRVVGSRRIEVVTPKSDQSTQLRSDNIYGDREIVVREVGVNTAAVDETVEGLKAFISAIQDNKMHPCLASDNLTTIEIANAIILAGVRKRRVGLPVDQNDYGELYRSLCERQ